MAGLQTLFEVRQLPAAWSTIFTAAVQTRIDKVTVCNTDASIHYVSLAWVPAGGSAANSTTLVKAQPLSPGQSLDLWPIMGHTLSTGDSIAAFADASASVNIAGSGLSLA